MRWMNLEPIIRTEVRKRKTNIEILMPNMESRKMVLMNLFAGQKGRCRYREKNFGHGVGGWKERVGQMERTTWKHTLPYVK